MVRSMDSRHTVAPEARVLADVVEEITNKVEKNEPVDLGEYQRRYPELADELEKVIPAIALLASVGDSARGDSPPVALTRHELPFQDDRLGDFRLLHEIGRGGMGVVYEAEQISLRRRVAVKVLPFAAILDPRQLERFRNETLAAAALKHPNIVSVYSVGCERSVHFYAMELVDGPSLADVARQAHCEPAPLDSATTTVDETVPVAGLTTKPGHVDRDYFKRIASLGLQAANALEHAHQKGIIHRDIKPSNLLIDASGNLFVTDFGLAQIEADSGLTVSGDILGTMRYMSPEQATGNRRILDHRTDIYSLGTTLYELLTGQCAFGGANRHKLLRGIAERAPRAPRAVNSRIPADLETIVLKAIAKEPVDRYATMSELADDIERFLSDQPIHARRTRASVRAFRWCRRNRLVASLLMCLALMAVVTAGNFVRSWHSPAVVYPPGTGITLRHVASGTMDGMGRVSSTGHYLSEINANTGNVSIIDLKNGGTRDVTVDGNWNDAKPQDDNSQGGEAAIWSPDGEHIAYSWSREISPGKWALELRIINADGSGQRTIYRTEGVRLLWPGTWSADGQHILVKIIGTDDSVRASLIAVDSGAEQVLISHPSLRPSSFSLSPGSEYIVYDSATNGTRLRDLHVLNTRTGANTALVSHAADEWSAQWTPDGRWVLFMSDRRGTPGLWGQRVDNGTAVGTPRLIKDGLGKIFPLGITRSGSYFYLTHVSRRDLYTANVDFESQAVTSAVSKLDTQFEGNNLIGSWSSDGKLAYLSSGTTTREKTLLTIHDQQAGRREMVVGQPVQSVGGLKELQWTPDGKRVVLLASLANDRGRGYVELDVETGDIQPFLSDLYRRPLTPFVWSPDGQFIYVFYDRAIIRVETATNQQTRFLELPPEEGPFRGLAISSNGEQLALAMGDVVRVVSPHSGESRVVFTPSENHPLSLQALACSPDGNDLIVGTHVDDHVYGTVSLWHVPLRGNKKPLELGIQERRICHVRIHPNGNGIMFAAGAENEAELWAIDNVVATLNSTK